MGCGRKEPEVKYITQPAPESVMTPAQTEMEKLLADYAKKYGTQYVPGQTYPGISTLTTPTSYEQTGLDILKNYLTSPSTAGNLLTKYISTPTTAAPLMEKFISGGFPEILGQAKEQVTRLLQPEEYDPYTSPYYTGTLKELEKQRKQSVSRIKNLLAAGGQRGTGYETGRFLEAEENVFDQISNLVAGIGENERTRQLNTVLTLLPFMSGVAGQEQAMTQEQINAARILDLLPLEKIQAAQQLDELPLQKVAAGLQYGSLPRMLEQTGYEDFIRRRNELAGALGIGGNVLQMRYPMAQTQIPYLAQPEASGWTNITGTLGNIAGMISNPIAQGSALALKTASANSMAGNLAGSNYLGFGGGGMFDKFFSGVPQSANYYGGGAYGWTSPYGG